MLHTIQNIILGYSKITTKLVNHNCQLPLTFFENPNIEPSRFSAVKPTQKPFPRVLYLQRGTFHSYCPHTGLHISQVSPYFKGLLGLLVIYFCHDRDHGSGLTPRLAGLPKQKMLYSNRILIMSGGEIYESWMASLGENILLTVIEFTAVRDRR